MRIPLKTTEKIYKQPQPEVLVGSVLDVSQLPVKQEESESINDKLKKLLQYLDPRDDALYVKGSLKSDNFVRNLKGWGLNVNKNGDAYFKIVIAGAYVQVFRQSGIPTSLHINDIWIDTDDDNYYVAAVAGATTIGAGAWVLSNSASSWSTLTDDDGHKPEDDATAGATFGTNISGGGSANTQVGNNGYATLFRQDKFGDGSDGDVTISADTTLTADMYYNNLTINTTKTLNTGGYRVFVKGTLTINGTGKIHRDGNAGGVGGNATPAGAGGIAGTAGGALAAGFLNGSIVGVAGGVGADYIGSVGGGGAGSNGVTGTNQTNALGSDGTTGGNGGTGGGTVGTGGVGGTATAATAKTKTLTELGLMRNCIPNTPLQFNSSASSGGGGGGGGGEGVAGGVGSTSQASSGGGGGSGSAGGIVIIFAKIIINNGTISAKGGAGGNGGNGSNGSSSGALNYADGGGGGGGGAGSSGGVLIISYNFLTNNGTISANGGAGGNGGTGGGGSGTGGTAGSDGSVGSTGGNGLLIQLEC